MTLGEKLRSIRKENKKTLVEVEQSTGITQSYLSKLERNIKVNPSLDILNSLAEYYKVDLKWLLEDYSQEKNSNNSTSSERIKQEIIELLEIVEKKDLPKILSILHVFIEERR